MNCFSKGLEVKRRWRSVPRSSVTKYLDRRGFSSARPEPVEGFGICPYMSSSGEMKMSLRLMTLEKLIHQFKEMMVPCSHSHAGGA